MGKHKIRGLAIGLMAVLSLAGCTGTPESLPNGLQDGTANQGPQGEKGDPGRGILSIALTSRDGNVDTYTITYTDGSTSTFTVTNGKNGEQGIQGLPGQDGHTPVITIGENGHWFIDGTDSGIAAQGPKGDQGEPGKDGTNLLSGEGDPLDSLGNVGDSYIDTESWDYYIKTAAGWTRLGNLKGEDGAAGNPGVGIASIELSSSDGNVDTYVIKYTDGSTSSFTVTNGADGEQGIQGIPGENGHTPVVTIGENGHWFIDGVDSGTEAQGPKGDQGDDGLSAYEIYLKYHPEYGGDEEQWISDLVNGLLGEKRTHTVTFDSAGGTPVDSKIVEHNELVEAPENPTRVGYQFAGWKYEGDSEFGPTESFYWNFGFNTVPSDLTLVAQWEANTYTVNFIIDGIKVASALIKSDDRFNPMEIGPNPFKGYRIIGWTDEEGKMVAEGPFQYYRDLTLNPVFQPSSFTIVLDSEDPNVNNSEIGVEYDSHFQLPVPSSPAGYPFYGWFMDGVQITDETGASLVPWSDYEALSYVLDDVYVVDVASQDDLQQMRNDTFAVYSLTQDIDLTGEWVPIGTLDDPFSGILFGNGHSINGMTITDSNYDYVGFFGAVGDLTVSDLAFADSTIVGAFTHGGIGIVAGADASLLRDASGLARNHIVLDSVTIESSCQISVETGEITDDIFLGGLMGAGSYASVTECTNHAQINFRHNADISAASDNIIVGGLFGVLAGESLISAASNDATIRAITNHGYVRAGGLIGLAARASLTLETSYNLRKIEASTSGTLRYADAGGLIGNINDDLFITDQELDVFEGTNIRACYNNGEVSSHSADETCSSGGLVGYINFPNTSIDECYNLATITANSETYVAMAGGLVGRAFDAFAENSYNTGDVSASNDGNSSCEAGGLYGYANYSSANHCFTVADVSSTVTAGGLFGRFGPNISDLSNCFAVGTVKGQAGKVDEAAYCDTFLEYKNVYVDCELIDVVTGETTEGQSHSGVMVLPETVDASFFVYTLGFNEAVWDLTVIDFTAGVYPSLYPPSALPTGKWAASDDLGDYTIELSNATYTGEVADGFISPKKGTIVVDAGGFTDTYSIYYEFNDGRLIAKVYAMETTGDSFEYSAAQVSMEFEYLPGEGNLSLCMYYTLTSESEWATEDYAIIGSLDDEGYYIGRSFTPVK